MEKNSSIKEVKAGNNKTAVTTVFLLNISGDGKNTQQMLGIQSTTKILQ